MKDYEQVRRDQSSYLYGACMGNKNMTTFLLLFINGMLSKAARKMIMESMDKNGVDEEVIEFYKMLCYHDELGVQACIDGASDNIEK